MGHWEAQGQREGPWWSRESLPSPLSGRPLERYFHLCVVFYLTLWVSRLLPKILIPPRPVLAPGLSGERPAPGRWRRGSSESQLQRARGRGTRGGRRLARAGAGTDARLRLDPPLPQPRPRTRTSGPVASQGGENSCSRRHVSGQPRAPAAAARRVTSPGTREAQRAHGPPRCAEPRAPCTRARRRRRLTPPPLAPPPTPASVCARVSPRPAVPTPGLDAETPAHAGRCPGAGNGGEAEGGEGAGKLCALPTTGSPEIPGPAPEISTLGPSRSGSSTGQPWSPAVPAPQLCTLAGGSG